MDPDAWYNDSLEGSRDGNHGIRSPSCEMYSCDSDDLSVGDNAFSPDVPAFGMTMESNGSSVSPSWSSPKIMAPPSDGTSPKTFASQERMRKKRPPPLAFSNGSTPPAAAATSPAEVKAEDVDGVLQNLEIQISNVLEQLGSPVEHQAAMASMSFSASAEEDVVAKAAHKERNLEQGRHRDSLPSLVPLPPPVFAPLDVRSDSIVMAEPMEDSTTLPPILRSQRNRTSVGFHQSGVGEPTSPTDELSSPISPTTGMPRRRRRLVIHLWIDMLKAALMTFYIVPVLVVALVTFAFSQLPARLCTIDCDCSSNESAVFSFTYGLVLSFPRCLLYAMMADILVHSVGLSPQRGLVWDLPSVVKVLKRYPMWILCILATLSYLIVESQAYRLPDESRNPVAIVATVLPFAAYCIVNRAVRMALPICLLMIIPDVYDVIIPQYRRTPNESRELLPLWVVAIGAIDRLFLYSVYAILPSKVGTGIKVLIAHIVSFYSQSMIVSMAMSMDPSESPAIMVVYYLLMVLVEFLLCTLLLERLWHEFRSCIANRLKNDSWRPQQIVANDIRSIATQTRHMTIVMAMLASLPVMGVREWPGKHGTTTCEGQLQVEVFWIQLLYIFLVESCVVAIVSALRWKYGRLRLPLYIANPAWGLACGLYLALLAPTALRFLPITVSSPPATTASPTG